jgi:hypothetical protein
MSAEMLDWPMRLEAEALEERDKRPGLGCCADIYIYIAFLKEFQTSKIVRIIYGLLNTDPNNATQKRICSASASYFLCICE